MKAGHRQEQRSSLRDLAYVVFRRKWVILGTLLATFIPATIYTLKIPPVYEAKSDLLVKPGRENIYVSPVGSPEGTHPPTIVQRVAEVINSEIQILKSRVLIRRVIEQIGIEKLFPGSLSADSRAAHAEASVPIEGAVARALKSLSAQRLSDSDVIEVAFRSHDPRIAADFLTKLVDLYLERHVEVYRSGQSYGFFRGQSDQLEEKLRTADRRLSDFKKKYSIVSFDQLKKNTLEQYMAAQAAKNENEAEIISVEEQLARLKEDFTKIAKHRTLSQDESSDPPVISDLKRQLAALELEKARLMYQYKPNNYKVIQNNEAIAKAQEMLEAEEKKFHGSVRTGLSGIYENLEGQILTTEARLIALKSKQPEIEKWLIEYSQELERLGRLAPELQALERAVAVNEQNYRLYLTKFEESRISDAMDAARLVSVSILEPPTAPLGPVGVNRMLNLFLSLCLGGVAGLGLAFLIDYFDQSFKIPEDVQDNLKVPLLGTVNDLPDKETEDPQTLATSPAPPPHYEILKNNIIMRAQVKGMKILSIFSPTPKEGASTIAFNLASALTKDKGCRVLLVDANLRHPVVHSTFNIPPSPGLVEVIHEGLDVHKAIRESVIPNLFLLTGGDSPANPVVIFKSEKWVDLIELLRKKFHWVIFDGAPINLYPDATVLAPRVDAVVLVVEAENKRAEVAIQAKEHLEEAGAKVIGAVLNRRRHVIPEMVYRRL